MAKGAKPSGKLDFASILGILIAVSGIVGGLYWEGGSVWDIVQPTGALIVIGGTLGAVMLSTPFAAVKRSVSRMFSTFNDRSTAPEALIEEIVGYASQARRKGLISLEQVALTIDDRFLRKSLSLAVDGTDIQDLRAMMELDIGLSEQRYESEAKVFEAAGGYAPTIGIIGAVLGLIQVMKHLGNTDEVGKGIAVAFVATVYGVGIANLFCLPMCAKIRARGQEDMQRKELILEGVISIVEGLNPKLIRSKLEAFARATGSSMDSFKRGQTGREADLAQAGD
jgi:chemotaxis protein MotA